jgi:hypothetical protein
MSEPEPVTRVTLFVPGRRDLVRADVPGEWIDNPGDGSFADAFSFGTVGPDRLAEIDSAPGALLVQLTDDLLEGRAHVIAAVEALHRCGALAIRLEQSKLGWAVERWLELAAGNPWMLHRCMVTMLLDKGQATSCGMHAFSLPDARVDVGKGSPQEAQELLSTLNVYQIAEDPLLLSGQTFSPEEGAPRRVIQRWPDDGYPSDHWCHNPYGLWRLGPEGGTARSLPDLHPLFVPSLVSQLLALERKNQRLTREQVEATTQGAACIATKHRDAQRMERSRGYADLDPELVWEQWCVFSAHRQQSEGST